MVRRLLLLEVMGTALLSLVSACGGLSGGLSEQQAVSKATTQAQQMSSGEPKPPTGNWRPRWQRRSAALDGREGLCDRRDPRPAGRPQRLAPLVRYFRWKLISFITTHRMASTTSTSKIT